ncbi:MAG: hypothetical protein ABSF22_00930 [Bryobacteraceae bacterium]
MGAPIGTINDTRSTFELNSQSFGITRSGFLAPQRHLKFGDTLIVTASRKPFLNHYTFPFGGKEWTFKAMVLLATKFGLFENETQRGTISAGPVIKRLSGITAELPDELPHDVQMFLLSIFISQLTTPSN